MVNSQNNQLYWVILFQFFLILQQFGGLERYQIYSQIPIFFKTFEIQIAAKCARNARKMPYTTQKMRIALNFSTHIDLVQSDEK